MDHHGAANDGVLANERDHAVSNVELGAASLSSHVTQISHVSLARAVIRSSVLAFVRIEVRSSAGAAVGVVSELEISTG